MGLELGGRERSSEVHGLGEADRGDVVVEGCDVAVADRRADDGQGGSRPVELSVGGQHGHEVMRCLVGRDLAHVEEDRTAGRGLGLLEASEQRRIRRLVGLAHVDEQRGHRGRGVAEVDQLALVVGRVGETEHAGRGELGELAAAEAQFMADGGLPAVDQPGRGDVVVVDDDGVRKVDHRVEHGAADGGVVHHVPIRDRGRDLDDRMAEGRHVGGRGREVDVRLDAALLECTLDVDGVGADRVSADEGGEDLVDPHASWAAVWATTSSRVGKPESLLRRPSLAQLTP